MTILHIRVVTSDNVMQINQNVLFSAIAQVSKHNQAKFRALANMGDVLIKMNNHEEAIKVYQKQLALAKQGQDKVSEASAFGWLGVSHRLLKRFDKSLGFHTQVCRKNCKYAVIRVEPLALPFRTILIANL